MAVLLCLLPIAAVFGLLRRHGRGRRESLVGALLAWGTLTTAASELLSLAGALTFAGAAMFWAGADLLLLGWLAARRSAADDFVARRSAAEKSAAEPRASVAEQSAAEPRATADSSAAEPRATDGWMPWAVAAIVAVIAVTALSAPPNNFDSMTYHMARVGHWVQNGSVAHYPTGFPPQLYRNPWVEFGALQTVLLTGGDRFAALPQFAAMVGSIAAASLIAGGLGGGRTAQTLAALVTATLPAGIVQASGTQTDYGAAFGLTAFAHYLLSGRRASDNRSPTRSEGADDRSPTRSEGAPNAEGAPIGDEAHTRASAPPRCASGCDGLATDLAAGAALGLAVLCKGTAYVFGLPFLIWYAASRIRAWGAACWRPALAAAGAALAANAGHYARNFDLYGTPLGPTSERPGEFRHANADHSAAAVASNFLRNTAVHLATPLPIINRATERIIKSLHRHLGIDVEDPATTFTGVWFDVIATLDEDRVGNLLHLGLITACWVSFAFGAARAAAPAVYLLCLAGGVLLFCELLTWQPWHCRLHTPLFVLAAPFAAVVLARAPALLRTAVAVLLTAGAVPYLVAVNSKPFAGEGCIFTTPRLTQYYVNRPQCEGAHRAAAELLARDGCREIGMFGWEIYEYPLRMQLAARLPAGFRLQYVNVTNESAALAARPPFSDFRPDALVGEAGPELDAVTVNGVRYRRVLYFENLSVYRPVPTVPPGGRQRAQAVQAGTCSSSSSSQTCDSESLGARQSPRGDSEPPEPTLGALGTADRLN